MGAAIEIALAGLLKKQGMSQYELARRSGVSYPTINGYYNNTSKMYSRDTILKICLALDCTPGDLIRLVETEE